MAKKIIGDPEVYASIEQNNFKAFESLVLLGHDINQKDATGMTPLMLSAYLDRLEFINFLIQKGARLDFKNNEGSTALMLAARNGHCGIVSTLNEAGARIFIRNKEMKSALDLAVEAKCTDVIDYLKANRADSKGLKKLYNFCGEFLTLNPRIFVFSCILALVLHFHPIVDNRLLSPGFNFILTYCILIVGFNLIDKVFLYRLYVAIYIALFVLGASLLCNYYYKEAQLYEKNRHFDVAREYYRLSAMRFGSKAHDKLELLQRRITYLRNCELDNNRACHLLAKLEPEMSNAHKYYYQACKNGYWESCIVLGVDSQENNRLTHARQLFDGACYQGKIKDACYKLADLEKNDKNSEKVFAIYKDLCISKDEAACQKWILSVRESSGLKASRKLYDKVCTTGDGKVCNQMAAYEKNNGSKKIARALYKKSCKLGNEAGCSMSKSEAW